MRIRALVAAISLLALTGCGGSDGEDRNAAAIEEAAARGHEQREAEADVLAELRETYRLRHYAGVDNVFEIDSGELCDVQAVGLADEYPFGVPENDLQEPDGEIVVEVNYFTGSDRPGETVRAECLEAVKDALGW